MYQHYKNTMKHYLIHNLTFQLQLVPHSTPTVQRNTNILITTPFFEMFSDSIRLLF